MLTVTGALHKDVIDAILDDDFSDFEDCLQVECAKAAQVDYIITRNVKDYGLSVTEVLSPKEFVEKLG